MRKTTYLLTTILLGFLLSCNGQPTKKDAERTTSVTAEEVINVENGKTVHLSKADFLKLVMDYEKNPDNWEFKGEKPCLIDFYADWCAPCRITSPILEDLAQQYAGKINVYKVDVDDEQELAAVFGIQSIPTFLFCPLEGKPTMSSGIANTPAATKDLFIQQIKELLLKEENGSNL